MKLTEEQYKKYTEQLANIDAPPQWRKGQLYFNVLYSMYPEVANSVRMTQYDPFHQDKVVDDFMQFIKPNNANSNTDKNNRN